MNEDDMHFPLSSAEHLNAALEATNLAGVPTKDLAEIIIGVYGENGAKNLANCILSRI